MTSTTISPSLSSSPNLLPTRLHSLFPLHDHCHHLFSFLLLLQSFLLLCLASHPHLTPRPPLDVTAFLSQHTSPHHHNSTTPPPFNLCLYTFWRSYLNLPSESPLPYSLPHPLVTRSGISSSRFPTSSRPPTLALSTPLPSCRELSFNPLLKKS